MSRPSSHRRCGRWWHVRVHFRAVDAVVSRVAGGDQVVWIVVLDDGTDIGGPGRDGLWVAHTRGGQGGIAPWVVCCFPADDGRLVLVAFDNSLYVVVERIADSLARIKDVVDKVGTVRFGMKVPDIGVHSAKVIRKVITREISSIKRETVVPPMNGNTKGGTIIYFREPIVCKRK